MDDETSEPDPNEPFSTSAEEFSSRSEGHSRDAGPDLSQEMDVSSLAFDVARHWIRDNQKAAMLGAFGVGVFVGVLLRD